MDNPTNNSAGIQNIEDIIVRIGPDFVAPIGVVHPLSRADGGYLSPLGSGKTSPDVKVLDIGLLVLESSVVNDHVYPVKPSFQRFLDTDTCGGFLSYYAGYGLTESAAPALFRQIQMATEGYCSVGNTLFNGALWKATFEVSIGGNNWGYLTDYWGTDHGDSGGPLFWLPTGQPYANDRQLIGVVQGGGYEINDWSADYWFSFWADITAPTLRNWLEQTAADPNRPGKWIGETDYTGPCEVMNDRDCDRIYDIKDNCPDDFNPEQADRDIDHIGDVCDNCWQKANPAQENCNKEIENRTFSLNQHVTGSMTASEVASVLSTNRFQRPGDACDYYPCNETRGEAVGVHQLGSPDPTACASLSLIKCKWQARTRITRRPVYSHDPPGVTGLTRMRFCQCNDDHATETQRRANASNCGCDMTSMTDFHASGGAWHAMHMSLGANAAIDDPAPQDPFWFAESNPSMPTDALNWEWMHDLPNITGVNPPASFPQGVPQMWVGLLEVNGILWSHVEEGWGVNPFTYKNEPRASHYRALDVRPMIGGVYTGPPQSTNITDPETWPA